MAQILLDIIYSFGNCMSCFPGSPTLKVNSRSFKILQLLGEVSPPGSFFSIPPCRNKSQCDNGGNSS